MSRDSDSETIGTVINPEKDGVEIELEFFEETMVGVEGVTMPDPPE